MDSTCYQMLSMSRNHNQNLGAFSYI
ncbi:MAG: hypothetical protein ACI9EQ_001192, partial [Bacteroidia bacterium]